MFKIGDRVKCINTQSLDNSPGILPPLVLNREYIIYDIHIHDCGSVCFDVGIKSSSPNTNCTKCMDKFSSGGIHWCNSKRFVKIEEKKEYKVVHSEIELEEPVLN